MASLDAVLADPAAASLYRLASRAPIATLRRRIERAGLLPSLLQGDTIVDKASFLGASAAALAFPAYSGHNWDAFEESLADLSWLPARGRVLLYDHPAPFIRRAPHDWAVARDILAAAVARWRDEPTPLWVLLRRTEGLLPGLPLLQVGRNVTLSARRRR